MALTSISLGPGYMAYLPPETLHEFDSADYAGERIIVMFGGKIENGNSPRKLPLSQLLKEIIFYLLTHPKAKSNAGLCNVFVETLGESMGANENAENPYHVIGKVKDPRLKKALEIVEERFSENIKIDAIAKKSGLSTRNFTRLLNQETGLSPKQLIMSLRVEEAKKLLQDGSTVLEASQAVGYDSLSQFIAAFRSRTGQLPSHFIRNG